MFSFIARTLPSDIARRHALRSISQWCTYWKLQIWAYKCHTINLSRRFGDCDTILFLNCGIIDWVPSLKFLGFFTWRGAIRGHAHYLRRKAFKISNIIKALSKKRYGLRSHHLVTLVQATVCSLFHYGAVILANACDSIFKRLEVIQTNALRTALGLT